MSAVRPLEFAALDDDPCPGCADRDHALSELLRCMDEDVPVLEWQRAMREARRLSGDPARMPR